MFARTFSEAEVAQFVGISWDVNPYHTDDEFCKTHRVGRRIAPGLLVGSMLTHIGGLAAVLATHIDFDFIAPVYPGDTVTATITIVEADAKRGWIRMEMTGVDQNQREVVRGSASGYPAKFREQARRNL